MHSRDYTTGRKNHADWRPPPTLRLARRLGIPAYPDAPARCVWCLEGHLATAWAVISQGSAPPIVLAVCDACTGDLRGSGTLLGSAPYPGPRPDLAPYAQGRLL